MTSDEKILMAHGGGGQLTAELIEQVILPALGGTQRPGALTDAAYLPAQAGELAMTTDSYVVSPVEFPGGDIGKLAICGTVNDLAVVGARPLALSMALVLEEGLEIALLRRVLESAGRAAREAGVAVVTGDTKVVERGKCDNLYINTAGIGVKLPGASLGFERVMAGDAVLVTGDLGEHGLAIMSRRKGLSFASSLQSDCAPLNNLCEALVLELGDSVRFLRDLTRGGLAAALADVAASAKVDIEIQESKIPISRAARAAAEMLGLDVLSAANEGKLVVIVADAAADKAMEILARFPVSRRSAVIGKVAARADAPGLVEMVTTYGGRRIVQMPYGEELPRIC